MFHETVEVLLENEAATAEDVRISFEMDRREICCNATKLCWIKMAAINVNVSFWMHLLRWVMPLENYSLVMFDYVDIFRVFLA